jgi:hypothetical protein
MAMASSPRLAVSTSRAPISRSMALTELRKSLKSSTIRKRCWL